MAASSLVVGPGGFGREVIDVVGAINVAAAPTWKVSGVMDDAPSDVNLDRLERRGVTYLGKADGGFSNSSASQCVAPIGSPYGACVARNEPSVMKGVSAK